MADCDSGLAHYDPAVRPAGKHLDQVYCFLGIAISPTVLLIIGDEWSIMMFTFQGIIISSRVV